MPDLEDIRAFSEVADSGSLTRAGARLGMSKSMISRRLARLEGELGAPLLARTTRGMSLTEAGRDFRPYAERMVAELEAARDALSRQGEATGRLRLSAPVSFGASHLAPVLAELAVRHPQLAISTSYSDRVVDLVGEGFDAAVRLGNLADSGLIARRIAPLHAVMVASPAYLARAGTPRTPAELARHEAVPHGDTVWEFVRDGRRFSYRPRGRFTADSGPCRARRRGRRARGGGDAGVSSPAPRSPGASWSRSSTTTRSRRRASTSCARRRPSRSR